MNVRVDTANQTVRSGDSAWPFRLDVRQGCATIRLGGVEYRVRPQSWQEKLRLSRYVRLGEAFLQSSFLDCCVSGGEPVSPEDQRVLLALAVWLNVPDDDTVGLPLDANQLAKVTLEVCTSMRVGPDALSQLAAPEVEILWRNLNREAQQDYPEQRQSPEPQFDTKIVVLPDSAHNETAATVDAPRSQVSQARVEGESQERQSAPASPSETAAASEPITAQAVPHPQSRLFEPQREQTVKSSQQRPSECTPPQGRFRVSFNTVAREERRATQESRRAVRQKTAQSAPTPSTMKPAPHASPNGNNNQFSYMPMESASVAAKPNETPQPQRHPLQSVTFTAIAAERFVPATTIAGAPDTRDASTSVYQMTSVESLLDEFCQRLDEAAADLGILEEV